MCANVLIHASSSQRLCLPGRRRPAFSAPTGARRLVIHAPSPPARFAVRLSNPPPRHPSWGRTARRAASLPVAASSCCDEGDC